MKHIFRRSRLLPLLTVLTLAVVAVAFMALGPVSKGSVEAQVAAPEFTDEFPLKGCDFKPKHRNPYFVLKPGYRLELAGEEDGTTVGLIVTVLNETKTITLPGIGAVETRIVEEEHRKDGVLVEHSRNYFATCMRTKDVYYFGEQVDIFLPDGTITHDGAWEAGVGGAMPGIVMPGTFLLGSRYFQEIAPGVAMDRAEHMEMGFGVVNDAGTFDRCVWIIETTPLEPGHENSKKYCHGVGLVADGTVELIDIGN